MSVAIAIATVGCVADISVAITITSIGGVANPCVAAAIAAKGRITITGICLSKTD